MQLDTLVNGDRSTRELARNFRSGLSQCKDMMPESLAWQTYLELHKRGYENANTMFVSALKNLHQRRSLAGSDISTEDLMVHEHRMTDDSLLSELWRAYKKCIRGNRTGPASELLREIAERIEA